MLQHETLIKDVDNLYRSVTISRVTCSECGGTLQITKTVYGSGNDKYPKDISEYKHCPYCGKELECKEMS